MRRQIDPTVKKETLFIAASVLVLSALMQAVFLIIGEWSLRVLWGNLLGAALAVGNFFLMGLSVQKALGKEEKDAAQHMKLSQRLRLLGLIVIVGAAIALNLCNFYAMLIPLLFPRIGVGIRGVMLRKESKNETGTNAS